MLAPYFFLIVEDGFHTSYLVSQWIEAFGGIAGFQGIGVREEGGAIYEHVARERRAFHEEYEGKCVLSPTALRTLRRLYPDLSLTGEAMIALFGVPRYGVNTVPSSWPLGKDLNSLARRRWLGERCDGERGERSENPPYFFIYVDQILLEWWMELTRGRVINGHPAVLPYARGMYALEHLANRRDEEHLRRAAGATVHYINKGIDTGPVIRAERLVDPFGYASIWELKAQAIRLAFRLLIETAKMLMERSETQPVGLPIDPTWRGPNFLARDFTSEVRRGAEEGYLIIKSWQQVGQGRR